MGPIIPILIALAGVALAGCSKAKGGSAEKRDDAFPAAATPDEEECGRAGAYAGDLYELADRENARAECCVRRHTESMHKEQRELSSRLDLISENMLNGHLGGPWDANAARASVDIMRSSAGPALAENHLSILQDYAALAARYSIDINKSIGELAGEYQDPDDYIAAIAVVVTLLMFGRLIKDVPGETALKRDIKTMVDEVVPAILAGSIRVKAEQRDFRSGRFNRGWIFISRIDSRARLMSSFKVIVHESRHALQYLRGKKLRIIDIEEEAGRVDFAAAGLLYNLHRRISPSEVEVYLDDYVKFRTSYFRHYLAAAKCMGLEGPATERIEGMIEVVAVDARKIDGELYSELCGESQRNSITIEYTRNVLMAEPYPYKSIDGVFGFIKDAPVCPREAMEDLLSTGFERGEKSLTRNAERMKSSPKSIKRAEEFAKSFKGIASCMFYLDKEEWNAMIAKNIDNLIFARDVQLKHRVKL